MPFSNIDKPSKYFDTKLYTGTGATQSITGLNFAPDWVWIKERSASASAHNLNDIVRGAGKALFSNTTDAEYDYGTGTGGNLRSFDSTGFSLGTASQTNANGTTFVSWCWDANGAGVSNTSGTITSTVSANTTAGFSIVSYTGTGATATVGHGLGVTPKMLIVKKRDSAGTDWTVWGSILGGTVGSEKIALNGTVAKSTGLNSSWFNNTAPTSTLFTVGTQSDVNGSGGTYIGYCFAEIKGYSKFGSYTGNGSTDGTFVYTGFKPAFVIIKQSSSAGEGWEIADNKRATNNVITTFLRNSTGDESTNTDRQFDFVSNGIKMRGTHGSTNASGSTYIYMCFAENPFVSSKGIPACAR